MTNVRQMFLELGTPRFLADMAIPMSWLLPGTTDPDEPATIEIVNSLQRGLRKLGYQDVRVNGVVDVETGRALDQVSGKGWVQRTWIQLMSDVISALRDPKGKKIEMQLKRNGSYGLGSYFEYDGYPPGPLPGILVGLPPGPLGALGADKAPTFTGTATDSGITLSYGKGKKDPSTMVPTNASTKAVFKNMQRQLNRVLVRVNKRISEDGYIGPKTRTAALSLSGKLGTNGIRITPLLITTGLMAANAVTLGSLFQSVANSSGVSTSANKSPPVYTPPDSTKKPMTPSQATLASSGGMFGQVKKYVPWVLLAGGVAFLAVQMKKGKAKKGKAKSQ